VAHYIIPWFLTHLPAADPANDLKLLKLLASSTSPEFVCALKKMCGQLWYLSEELVALPFVDQTIIEFVNCC